MSQRTTEMSREERIRSLSAEFFRSPPDDSLKRHRAIRRKYQAIQISGAGWTWIAIVSLILGLGVYGGVVAFSYWHTANAMQISRATFSMSWKPGIATDTAAAITLDDLGIAGDNDLKKELVAAIGLVRTASRLSGSGGATGGNCPR